MARGAIVATGVVLATALLAWALLFALPRRDGAAPSKTVSAAPAAASAPTGRKIKARLFYVADDGLHLMSVEREVIYGEGATAQAREIAAAQIAAVAEPLVSPIPPGTSLRSLFITEHGDAYVDLSREAATAHPGGTTTELLTVYALVDALTVNLPAVHAVQILIDGKEVDTLAGHVDLRRPLPANRTLIRPPAS